MMLTFLGIARRAAILRRFTTAVIVCGAVFLAFSACERAPAPAKGASAPRFELKDSAGKSHGLENLRGNVVLIHFWASWCPPCLDEIPRWVAAASQFGGLPVKLVAISVDEQWPQALKVLPQANVPPNMISLLDPESATARAFGTTKFPESYLLDTELRIVDKWMGVVDWKSPRVRFAVSKAIIQSKKATEPSGSPPMPAPAPSAR